MSISVKNEPTPVTVTMSYYAALSLLVHLEARAPVSKDLSTLESQYLDELQNKLADALRPRPPTKGEDDLFQ